MTTTPTKEPFAKSSGKTYSLVEIVRGRTTMVDKGPDDTVFAFPVVAILELLIALGAGLGLLLFSLLKNAPLESLANPLITTDPAKAPWYFMGLARDAGAHASHAGWHHAAHAGGAVPDCNSLHR